MLYHVQAYACRECISNDGAILCVSCIIDDPMAKT